MSQEAVNNENKENKKEQRSKENWIKVKSRVYQIFEEPFLRRFENLTRVF